MIQRKSAVQNKSLVNSASEEHFNIVKGIRDDAPITDINSVIKSVNFESDGDGSYVLRKPLMKKESLNRLNTQEAYLYDYTHKLTIGNDLVISGATKVILKCYDNDYKEWFPLTNTNNNVIEGFSTWATVKKIYNTNDHTLLSCEINHRQFLNKYGELIYLEGTETPEKWTQSLSNVTKFYLDSSSNTYVYKTLTILKRFIKIYESVDEPGTFIVEIIHPEINSFTSSLDVGNTEALEANLLLDNPYAIRDLYNYGYWSATKILPYIIKDEDNFDSTLMNEIPVWELTESDFIPSSETENNPPSSRFRLLISTNKTLFKATKLILKAFITTVETSVDMYCCWEESSNGGIDWDVCKEFIDKFNLTETDVQTVADLSSKEFNEMFYKESLEQAQTYVVSKKLYHLPHVNFHQDDSLSSRPDVLYIENPDLSKMYRFVIYIDSNQTTPTKEPVTITQPLTSFTDISGNIDTDGNVKYEVVQNDGPVPGNDNLENACLVLRSGNVELPEGAKVPTVSIGNSLRIYTENPLCQLVSISYSAAAQKLVNAVVYDAGSFIGVANEAPTNANIPESLLESNTNEDYTYKNIFNVPYSIKYWNSRVESITTVPSTVCETLWVKASTTKTMLIQDGLSDKSIQLFNISNNMYKVSTNRTYTGPEPFIVGNYIVISKFSSGANAVISYNDKSIECTEWANVNEDSTIYPLRQNAIVIHRLANGSFGISQWSYHFSIIASTWLKESQIQSEETASKISIAFVDGYQVVQNELPPDRLSNTVGQYGYTDSSIMLYTFSDKATYTVETSYDDGSHGGSSYSDSVYKYLRTNQAVNVSGPDQIVTKIANLTVTFKLQSDEKYASVYLNSTTGNYQVYHSKDTKLAEDLSADRDRLFSKDSNYYYNEQQAQLLIYNNNFVYSSGTNSAIVKLMNTLNLPEPITKIIQWRGYLLLFSDKNIYLASYDSSIDGYNIKVLSNTVGVSKEDADTVVPILNSVYFKSGTKIYKLVPNLYAASDDILNIHQISVGINNILENIVNTNIETHNFGYSDSDTYMVFIPVESLNKTYCIVNTFNKNLWMLYEYPIYLENIEVFSLNKVYLYSNTALYYFRESLDRLLQLGLAEYCQDVGDETSQYDLNIIKNAVPYADYLNSIPKDLIVAVLDNVVTSDSFVETFKNLATPIQFEIDFGQKSSNYTLDKQYLESKLILATLSSKEAIPLSLDIYTDGVSRELHFDANTDGAIWRTSLDSMGILNTGFGINGQDYNGILRQLVVKYSGRGKSIRHVISGESKSLFKFYSMDVRGRLLPKKG